MNLSRLVSAPRRLCAPSFVLLMASLLFAAPAAHAGTWQFTCTGSGSEIQDTRTPTLDNTQTQTWMPPGSSTGSSYQLGGFSVTTQPGAFSTTGADTTKSGGGTISAAVMLTWVPDAGQTATNDPAPTSVLLNESSSASWTALVDNYPDPYTTGGTSADDGLGDAEVATYYSGVKNGGTSSGSHYSAQTLSNGTLTLNRSFSAQATASAGPSTAGICFGFSFGSYTLAVASPTIKISGTYDPTHGDYRVLTGQRITATLQGLSGYTVTKYTWAVGGSAFKTYNETAPSNQLVPLGSMDLTGPAAGSSTVTPLSFYDGTKENLTVTCTATVLAPDGKTSLDITATAPPINVLKPTLTHWDIAEGYVQPNNTANSSTFGLYGNLSGTGNSTNGMIWSNVTVDVPAPFSGNGQCTFTQLLNPNRIAYVNGVSKSQARYNGILGIDGSFNYGSSWGVAAAGNDADSPNQPLYYTPGLTGFSDSDAFTTYVMYQPSGGVWVPLERISWMWSVTLDWQPETSQFKLTASYPYTAGQAGTPTHVPTSAPPQWTVIHPSK